MLLKVIVCSMLTLMSTLISPLPVTAFVLIPPLTPSPQGPPNRTHMLWNREAPGGQPRGGSSPGATTRSTERKNKKHRSPTKPSLSSLLQHFSPKFTFLRLTTFTIKTEEKFAFTIAQYQRNGPLQAGTRILLTYEGQCALSIQLLNVVSEYDDWGTREAWTSHEVSRLRHSNLETRTL